MDRHSKSNVKFDDPPSAKSGWIKKLVFLLVVLGLGVLALVQFGDALTLERLASNEAALRQYQHDHPVLVYGVAFTLYVAVTGLSLPGAAGMTLVVGWFFGFWPAIILASLAATTGATLAFLSSRFLLRDFVQQRFAARMQTFHEALQREGAFYLFALRLIPVVPFFVINLVMGVTPIRLWTFCWVSLVGMLAGTAVYAYAGSSVPTLQALAGQGVSGVLSPRVLVALVILGLFPFLVRQAVAWFRRRG